MAKTLENDSDPEPHRDSPTLAQPRCAGKRAIVIQLTSTERGWDSTEDGDLVFTLDGEEEGPSVSFSRERPSAASVQPDDLWGLRSPAFQVSVSPSSPGSLGNTGLLALHSSPVLSPVPKALVSLVKSPSSEMEAKEASSALKHKPLLSLVKSLSTEISRREPEVSQSKSDSKLNLHLWRQLTQPKDRDGDSKTAPPSPCSPSSPEPKGGFFKVELEDTRRKFSEAMQEPLSMLSKIMGDESSGSPKLQRDDGATDSPLSLEVCGGSGGQANGEVADPETPRRRDMRVDVPPSVCETPLKRPKRPPLKPCPSPELHRHLGARDSRYEICAYGDVIQVVEIKSPQTEGGALPREPGPADPPSCRPVAPGKWLVCVTALAYSFFVLPLPSCLSALSLGLACGFVLGLLVVFLLAPSPHRSVPSTDHSLPSQTIRRERKDPEVLEGWMNEMHSYDPETYHPSLTHSVRATLKGSSLQLAYPRANIPRSAAFNEQPHDAVFLSRLRFQLAGSKVFLWPPALARKRVWNKKYPICIVLIKGAEQTGDDQCTDKTFAEEELTTRQTGLPTTLYLFGRTGREKEEWFQHLLSASKMEDSHSGCGSKSGGSVLQASTPPGQAQCNGGSSGGSTEDIPSLLRLRDLAGDVREKILLDYSKYMARFVVSEDSGSPQPCAQHSPQPSPSHSALGREKVHCEPNSGATEGQTAWINAFIGRIFWDFLREKYWSDQVAIKIQKKLSKIRLPYFMNELTLTDLDMGTSLPQVVSTSMPSVDQRGLWLDLEVVYTGSLQMTLETKMNLCKLGKESCGEADCARETRSVSSRPKLCVLADSDEESSSAGSSDEEEIPPTEFPGSPGDKGTPLGADGHSGGSTSRKILRFVDKIAKSKYFQKATENEYIKKKIAEVSNTPLLLTVEVLELSGNLTVNIPPPPTDRIWYSFRVPPQLDLRVRPMLGEREVTFSHVTEWIEKKLQREFQKVFVMPNMDDLYLSLMHSGLDHPPPSQHSPDQSWRQSSDQSWRQSSEESPDKEDDSFSE